MLKIMSLHILCIYNKYFPYLQFKIYLIISLILIYAASHNKLAFTKLPFSNK